MDPHQKVFSEKEAGELLQRAVKLQESGQSGGGYTPGVTLDELEKIANEAGVDPKYLHEALRNANSESERKGWHSLSDEYERVIDGELPPEHFDVVLEHVRNRNFGRGAGVNQVGRTMSVDTFTGGTSARVTITSRNGRTRVNVRSTALGAYFLSLHPTLILGFVLGGNLCGHGYVWQGLASGFGLVGAGFALFTHLVKRGKLKARELADKIATSVEDENEQFRRNLARSTPISVESSQVSNPATD